jgi:hypothetical protein
MFILNLMMMENGMSKSEVKTRKAQLIHTFGPGAMQVNKDGISMLTCGLDHWFTEAGSSKKIDKSAIEQYLVEDERLSKKLGVKEFRSPPDSIVKFQDRKISAPLPAQRFPYWHICSNTSCQAMKKESSIKDDKSKCGKCNSTMYQSRFIALCSKGHIQDFPWVDWINFNINGSCTENCDLALVGTGSTSSAGIKVKCKTHVTRPVSLAGVFQTKKKGDKISTSTLSEKGIRCSGAKPWLGVDNTCTCDEPLVAALRQATNVYFAKSDSSILIPIHGTALVNRIFERWDKVPRSQKDIIEAAINVKTRAEFLLMHLGSEFELSDLISFFDSYEIDEDEVSNLSEIEYRHQEYVHFLKENKEGCLVTKVKDLNQYDEWMVDFFSNITQVKQITVTNAFYGFDRIQPNKEINIDDHKKDLWDDKSHVAEWLPAVKVYGEGIFIDFNSKLIKEWSSNFSIKTEFTKLREKALSSPLYENVGVLSPAYLLIHTFSHLLINQLIFDCGYSTASLRERIYVSQEPDMEMYGVLIYTAAGDSEGSLGGLVRMAEPRVLEAIIRKAIDSSNWCSSDPICREQGDKGGQGPYGMNLAACHNCALLPETSCENFNTLLDRGCITSKDLDGYGYFDSLY